ncbi:MAG: DNA polymerase III subunit beta [Candidatus Eisenbacteria bacterium]|uniref:Beta sliding clamp n=1 Tax=Eiseniibacteriota bacterium TaxID=2212470 RepID=A0A538TVQ1_UNCEI|nr:MAG: DNA polymerase III subunit beta [Candidatus Eisenbacteria bacterium]
MELTIQQTDLAFAAGKALGSVSAKSPMPLLSCLLLEADKGALRVTGTDLEITTAVTVPCEVESPGRVAVPGRHFHEVVRKIARGPLTLSQNGEQCEVRYGDGKGWSRFPTQDAADFPRVPEFKAETKIALEPAALSRLVQRTAYATSSDATRPMLSGVLVHGSEKKVVLVSTDGHRLARATRTGSFGGLGKDGVIVPSKALEAVSRTAEEATAPVEVELAPSRSQASFAAQVGAYRVQVIARLLQGPYPNYEQVIPKNNPKEITVTRDDLLEAVDIVASHADNVTRQVRFALRGGRIGISSATELGAGEHQVQAEYGGEDMDVGYNATYLMEMLRSMPAERVKLKLGTPLAAGVAEPAGGLPESEEELLCLIMPLRLPDAAE